MKRKKATELTPAGMEGNEDHLGTGIRGGA